MEYKKLRSVFYEDKDPDKNKYEQEYQCRLESESAIHIPLQIKGYPAFLLNTPEMTRLTEEIYTKVIRLKFLASGLPRVALTYIIEECLMDEVQTTNEMEGVHSSREEIEKAMISREQVRFLGIVRKYKVLMEKAPDEMFVCTLENIRRLYDEIFLDEIEEKPDGTYFRKREVHVFNKHQKRIHDGLLPEEEINKAMEASLAFLKNEEAPYLVRVAVLHYLFGYIHPFYDGNGRTDRLISSYLIAERLEPLLAIRLSYVIKDNRETYYKAFDITNDRLNRGDLTFFVSRFMEIVGKAADSMEEKLRDASAQLDHFEEYVNEKRFLEKFGVNDRAVNMLYVLAQNELFAYRRFNMKELAKVMKVAPQTLSGMVDRLVDAGLPVRVWVEGNSKRIELDVDAVLGM